MALKLTSFVPAAMAVLYLLILLYFKGTWRLQTGSHRGNWPGIPRGSRRGRKAGLGFSARDERRRLEASPFLFAVRS
jgi:hypothetical protein